MKKYHVKRIALAVGLALAAPAAMAATWDFSGSNIYMKFLDGDRRIADKIEGNGGDGGSSIDTASGSDRGQFAEVELRAKVTVSPKVEAGFRIQSRSSGAYWSEFGGFGSELNIEKDNNQNKQNYMRLRGIYVQLTPGYSWLSNARIGSSDWGYFDPMTVGQYRYIDRDNVKGFYFSGPALGGTWEAARITQPEYASANWSTANPNGEPVCDPLDPRYQKAPDYTPPSNCGYGNLTASDQGKKQRATYIVQFKAPVGPARLTASAQTYNDNDVVYGAGADNTPLDGRGLTTFFSNDVYKLALEGSAGIVDLKGAVYQSSAKFRNGGAGGGPAPKSDTSGSAFKLDAMFAQLPVDGLSLKYQYFNIGKEYFSMAAARRESDILLTEGSESAWFQWYHSAAWGRNQWVGGSSSDSYQQVASSGWFVDNNLIDFNEAPAESIVGWKGHTIVADYTFADTPMSFEYSRIGYNNDRQNYTGPMADLYAGGLEYFAHRGGLGWDGGANQDRRTSIAVFKASHTFAGGIEGAFKAKWVRDTDKFASNTSVDDRDTNDTGYIFSAGKQLYNDLYGKLAYGHYTRDITVGATNFDNVKNILTLDLTYTLPGMTTGLLTQWITGRGDPSESGTQVDVKQYRLKGYLSTVF